MTARLRWIWSRLNANYWFYPALFALTGVLLGAAMVALDRSGYGRLVTEMSAAIPARPEGASTILTVISSSMIGVAATVFSITIAAVAYASGNYGPRLLTNFMEDKGNQFSLATFIGTFTYSLTVLRTIRSAGDAATGADLPDAFVPQLSLLVAYALMALSIAVLVYFLNHIPASIRINTVLEGIAQRLLHQIRSIYTPDEGGDCTPPDPPDGRPVKAGKAGYVQLIDFESLDTNAREAGCTIALKMRVGDFVHGGVTIAEVAGNDGGDFDDLANKVQSAIELGSTRTPEQDPQFLIDELVEIALRALSPGINDPFTAITAVHWLGAATAELGGRDLRSNVPRGDDGTKQRVFPLPDDFRHFVKRGFGSMHAAAATNRLTALVLLDTLENAATAIDRLEYRAILREQGDVLLAHTRLALPKPDLVAIEERYGLFRQSLA
ncbi:MAG: DUF2254 domain-containing protein [Novosphingobium sp.]